MGSLNFHSITQFPYIWKLHYMIFYSISLAMKHVPVHEINNGKMEMSLCRSTRIYKENNPGVGNQSKLILEHRLINQ